MWLAGWPKTRSKQKARRCEAINVISRSSRNSRTSRTSSSRSSIRITSRTSTAVAGSRAIVVASSPPTTRTTIPATTFGSTCSSHQQQQQHQEENHLNSRESAVSSIHPLDKHEGTEGSKKELPTSQEHKDEPEPKPKQNNSPTRPLSEPAQENQFAYLSFGQTTTATQEHERRYTSRQAGRPGHPRHPGSRTEEKNSNIKKDKTAKSKTS